MKSIEVPIVESLLSFQEGSYVSCEEDCKHVVIYVDLGA